jgi:hypothetical protein
MTPNFHSEIEEQFYAYLVKRGYPRDSIAFEVRLGDRHRPDFAVTDLSRDQRIAYFEIKAQITPSSQKRIFDQIRDYSAAAKAVGAPCFLVTPAKSPTFEEPFDFYYVDRDDSVQQLAKELFPSYPSLASNSVATKKEQIETDTKETKDHFQMACWILAGIVLILAIADFFCDQKAIELVDATRLTLLGIGVALVVIPFAQKFKILGVEYERYLRESRTKTKSEQDASSNGGQRPS